MKRLIILATVLCSFAAKSQVLNRIEMSQKTNELHFKVTIQNSSQETLQFFLTKAAQLSSISLASSVPNNSYNSFAVKPLEKVLVEYSLSIEQAKPYFISSSDYWIPVLQNRKLEQSFLLQTNLWPGFSVIESATQKPQDDLAFVFGRFSRYESDDQRLKIFLLKPDAALAKTLLEKLELYLTRFEKELGPYPYSDFAVVESPEEIGYAFPRMTWMGSQVLRFPFILNTSLPHELLHSWWGNGVFVDYESGNWCEGLTAFGADYGLLDEKGKKAYRLKALSNYANYVKDGSEISLSKFVSRGEDRSLQAIGYDKAMMVFIMLEQQLGDAVFKKAIQNFYQKYQFKKASYRDFFEVLEQTSSQNLDQFEKYWIHSTGFVKTNFLKADRIFQPNEAFLNWIPQLSEITKIPQQPIQAQVQFLDTSEVQNLKLKVSASGQELLTSLTLVPAALKPSSYSVDPDFFLFRELSELEKPVTFSRLFGSPELFLLENDRELMADLKTVFPAQNILIKTEIDHSQPVHYLVNLDQAVKSKKLLSALSQKNVRILEDSIELSKQTFDLKQNAVFLTLRVENSYVTVFQLNQTLPTLRWFQRWSRYGAQSAVVLNSTTASFQEIWLDPFKRNF